MSTNVDSTDKSFFSKMMDDLKEDIRDIKNHFTKTCNELHEMDKNVVELRTEVKNLMAYNRGRENDKQNKSVSRREWIIIFIAGSGIVGTVVGILQSLKIY